MKQCPILALYPKYLCSVFEKEKGKAFCHMRRMAIRALADQQQQKQKRGPDRELL